MGFQEKPQEETDFETVLASILVRYLKAGNFKNEQKHGRVALFLISGVCKIRCGFEPFWRGLGDGFRSFLDDFGWILGLSRGLEFEGEVGRRFQAEHSRIQRLGGTRLGPAKGGGPQLGEG